MKDVLGAPAKKVYICSKLNFLYLKLEIGGRKQNRFVLEILSSTKGLRKLKVCLLKACVCCFNFSPKNITVYDEHLLAERLHSQATCVRLPPAVIFFFCVLCERGHMNHG